MSLQGIQLRQICSVMLDAPLETLMDHIPDFDILVGAVLLENMLTGDAHGAQSMQNRFVKPADSRELRKYLTNINVLPSSAFLPNVHEEGWCLRSTFRSDESEQSKI